jgi:isopenicillin N synthase-like dioxygenase
MKQIDLPLIDLGKSPSLIQSTLDEAFSKLGFTYLKAPDFPERLFSEISELSYEYFDQPLETKMDLATKRFRPNHKNNYRGYFPPETNKITYKEGFECGFDPYGEHPNVWPQIKADFNPSDNENAKTRFQEVVEKYLDHIHVVAMDLLNHLARILNVNNDNLIKYCKHSPSTLRLLHYPPARNHSSRETESRKTEFATPDHTDSGLLTILWQDNHGGFELLPRGEKSWIKVKPKTGTFLVNIGDALSILSGQRFHSTRHRVISQAQRRLSIPYFFEPDPRMPLVDLAANSVQSASASALTYGELLERKKAGFLEYQKKP